MSENDSNPQSGADNVNVHQICAQIRSENFNPLGWIFPIANSCTSCYLLTGGNPSMMATVCPKVQARLEEITAMNQTSVPDPANATEKANPKVKTE
jgi:hypothetical protein